MGDFLRPQPANYGEEVAFVLMRQASGEGKGASPKKGKTYSNSQKGGDSSQRGKKISIFGTGRMGKGQWKKVFSSESRKGKFEPNGNRNKGGRVECPPFGGEKRGPPF